VPCRDGYRSIQAALNSFPAVILVSGFGPAHPYSAHALSRLLRHGWPCDTAPGIHSSADRREWNAPSDRTGEPAHLARAGQWEHRSRRVSASGNAWSNSLAVAAIRYVSSPSSFETAIHPALQPSTPMCAQYAPIFAHCGQSSPDRIVLGGSSSRSVTLHPTAEMYACSEYDRPSLCYIQREPERNCDQGRSDIVTTE
jgi:hypothetical protein